jgi:hypothetical protein
METPGIEEVERALKEFVWEQAPLVAKEVVYWTIGSEAISALYAALLCLAFVILLAKGIKLVKRHWEAIQRDGGEPFLMVLVFPAIALFFSFCHFIDHTKSVVKGIVAPRLVIIDYVSEKVRGPGGK